MTELSRAGRWCLALFAAVFVVYITEAMPAAVISIAIVPALVLLKITDVNTALGGFSSTSTYLVAGSYILAAAMTKTGLGGRITGFLLTRVGSGVLRISLGIVMVNIVMAFMIPSSTARTAMLLPFVMALVEQYEGAEEDKCKYAENLLLTLCVTSSTISSGIMTSTVSNPMAVSYIYNASGKEISYFQWMLWGFLPALIMTIAAWLMIQICFRPRESQNEMGIQVIRQQMAQLGKISGKERYTVFIIGITIFLWIFGDKMGIDSATAALLGAVLLFFPGVRVLEWKDCQDSISVSVLFVISGGISLGNAMSVTGASDWLASQVLGIIGENVTGPVMIAAVIVIIQFMHLFFVGTAPMANAFFPILVSLALQLDMETEALIMPAAFMIGGYPVLTFFNTTPNILCYDTKKLKAADFLKVGLPISVIACVVYIACAFWYWPGIGLR
ncbi:MAG: DASS family sodium-coupled anion symporter [Lachnospiraceae bacterium]|nr:DASS family sodium-coupled anion symporter [Lachnospiraceae bacterium]